MFDLDMTAIDAAGDVATVATVATVDALMNAAMRCCNYWRDDEQAREDMRRDILSTPPEDRAELIASFDRWYPETTRAHRIAANN